MSGYRWFETFEKSTLVDFLTEQLLHVIQQRKHHLQKKTFFKKIKSIIISGKHVNIPRNTPTSINSDKLMLLYSISTVLHDFLDCITMVSMKNNFISIRDNFVNSWIHPIVWLWNSLETHEKCIFMSNTH